MRNIEHFRAISRRYSDASILMHEAIARKAGLSGTDHKYLGLIMQRGELTAGELAKITGLTTGAVTGLIDRLEKKDLVRRQFDSTDRRKVIIVPNTENALRLLTPLFAGLQEETSKLIASFSEREIEVIERYFQAAIALMTETTERINAQ
ncbi:MarR family transcriptional regulator [Hymenobacter busanensis]|uniref:MarR family transcriptional regulator n=1 Tax=Hymenobacter busanensis TaxID=2607656 RepID=A0A7L4ZSJ1_9BACT|nr:MarR family transcriptional regulator [Hymenobacter busanensis]KAA9327600.1 MarR family transcriptional regulator [Hymenobacter busanensis]QHJ06061.1 MarR family transcriptional regulator [Hymenobacter busanensis]